MFVLIILLPGSLRSFALADLSVSSSSPWFPSAINFHFQALPWRHLLWEALPTPLQVMPRRLWAVSASISSQTQLALLVPGQLLSVSPEPSEDYAQGGAQ